MGVTPIAGWLMSNGKYGKSYLEMEDNWGYPYFRKPLYLISNI